MISLDLEYVFRNENAYRTTRNRIKWLRERELIDLLLELLESGREQYREGKEFIRWLDSNT